jgi:hypothetical protein
VVNEQNNPCFATLIRIPFLSEGALRKAEGRAAAIGSLPMFRRILGKIWGVVPSEEQVLVEGLRLYAPKAEEGSPFSPPSDRPLLRALSTLSLLPEAIAEQCFRHAVLDPIEPLRSFLSTDYLLGLLPLVPAAYRDEVEEYLS